MLDWSACSPDPNPIENVWSVMVRDVYRDVRQLSNVSELKDAILNAWANICSSLLKNWLPRCPNGASRSFKNLVQKSRIKSAGLIYSDPQNLKCSNIFCALRFPFSLYFCLHLTFQGKMWFYSNICKVPF